MKSVLTVILFASSLLSFGQTTLQASGNIPPLFRYEDRVEYMKQLSRDRSSTPGKFNKLKHELLYANEFMFSEYVTDGVVIFGDEITTYLNDIVDELIGEDSPLRDSITVYTLRSRVPNAFMTPNGRMFVTLGLVAQVQNETELAFTLAHEIGHFVYHDFERKLRNGWDLRQESKYSERDKERVENLSNMFSREREAQSDLYAAQILSNSDIYNPENAIEMFDVLLFSYLPIDEYEFSFDWILPDSVQLSQDLNVEGVNPIVAKDDEDDTDRTHPNIQYRRDQYIEEIIDVVDDEMKMRSANPSGDERFASVNKLARREVIRVNLHDFAYPRAIYNAYVCAKLYPELTDEMRISTGMALHGLTNIKAHDFYGDINPEADETEGEIHRVYHFCENTSGSDIAAIAVAYNTQLHADFPDNDFVNRIYEASARDFVRLYSLHLSSYTADPKDLEPVQDTLSEEEFQALSKIDKIYYQRKLQGIDSDWLSPLMFKSPNKNQLEELLDRVKEEYENDSTSREGLDEVEYREMVWEESFDQTGQVYFDLDSVIFFEPWTYSYDKNFGSFYRINFRDALELREKIAHISQELVYEYGSDHIRFVSSQVFDESTIDIYNDYITCALFVTEDRHRGAAQMVNSYQRELAAVADRTGMKYLAIPTISVKNAKWPTSGGAVLMYVFPPFWPFLVGAVFIFQDTDNTFMDVYDMKTGEKVGRMVHDYRGPMSTAASQMVIYEMLMQLQN
ncbi:MAG: ImmA/IrrE family metallo-endopeptidase [Bacteroidetes bacterium]|nr:MAG: ImmA/IrrE family metallo-endopeptidase [Bacteroidota bacterium]